MMQTERLVLRLITEADGAFLHQLMNTPKWYKYIGDRKVRNEEDAIQYIRNWMHPDIKVKGFVNHVLIEKVSGLAVGTCSLHDREGVKGMDVGYALLPEFEGKGYATEGAKAMIELAFSTYNQTQVSAITNEENEASGRLLEKIGFVKQGYVQLPNSPEMIRLYVLENM